MKLNYAVTSLILLLAMLPCAFAQHWTPPDPTGTDHSLVITSAVVDDEYIMSDPDEIGVFTTGGILAGAVVVPDTGAAGMAAWGDDALTSEIIEGFVAGDTLIFKVWISSMEIELIAEPTFTMGPSVFQANGYSVLSLSAHTQSVPDRSENVLPEKIKLAAWPNPFNPSVTLTLNGIEQGWEGRIFNLLGQEIFQFNSIGSSYTWDGKDFDGNQITSGVYIVQGLNEAEHVNLRLVKVE